MITKTNLLNYMRSIVRDYVDPKTGEVNDTLLVEDTALHFHIENLLDEPDHPLWDAGIIIGDWYEHCITGEAQHHDTTQAIANLPDYF